MALYDRIGRSYARFRQPDLRIAAAIEMALGDAVSVVNVGAGSGSYEPGTTMQQGSMRWEVTAVEPSEVMIRQRPAGAAACVQASAESLPLESNSVDAAMSVLSMHHWSDQERGLREMARVARRRLVLLTWVPDVAPFWLTDEYFPEIAAYDRTIFPSAPALAAMLGRVAGPARLMPVPIPHDCIDGFLCAYWRRPEAYLDPDRRSVISSFARIDAAAGLSALAADLASGRWRERHPGLLGRESLDVGYRLVSCELARAGGD